MNVLDEKFYTTNKRQVSNKPIVDATPYYEVADKMKCAENDD